MKSIYVSLCRGKCNFNKMEQDFNKMEQDNPDNSMPSGIQQAYNGLFYHVEDRKEMIR